MPISVGIVIACIAIASTTLIWKYQKMRKNQEICISIPPPVPVHQGEPIEEESEEELDFKCG